MTKKYLRQRRQFSPTLRKQVVGFVESGKLSVAAASREYQVSVTSIYKWIHRYSTYNKKRTVLVVDKDSHSKKLEQLQQKIAKMEQAVGHKQMQIDYYEKFIDLASEVRLDHNQMGCHDNYYAVREQMPRGRDWTEQVLLGCGFRVKTSPHSFTVAGTGICSNLIEGMDITGPNQVWQTDITYVWGDGRWYYLSFVMDVFTRRILTSHCSRDLSAAGQIRCLAKAFASQKGEDISDLIVHTGRGVQYTSSEFTNDLDRREVRHSMARYAWQNAYCERVNRTIKHNYLAHYTTNSYDSLCRGVAKAVRLYNRSKPHRGLPSRLSPD